MNTTQTHCGPDLHPRYKQVQHCKSKSFIRRDEPPRGKKLAACLQAGVDEVMIPFDMRLEARRRLRLADVVGGESHSPLLEFAFEQLEGLAAFVYLSATCDQPALAQAGKCLSRL